jgi:hypothetical protein
MNNIDGIAVVIVIALLVWLVVLNGNGPPFPSTLVRRRHRCRLRSTEQKYPYIVELLVVGRDPARLVFAEQLGCRPPPWLFLKIDVGKLLPRPVRHEKRLKRKGVRQLIQQAVYLC